MKTLLSAFLLIALTATATTFLYFDKDNHKHSLISSSKTNTSLTALKNAEVIAPVDTVKTVKAEITSCFSYECAYQQYLDMLEGRKPVDFKRAVFIYENTYLKGTLNYNDFTAYFTETANNLREYIKYKGISAYKTAGQYAIFSYMYEPSPLNNNQIFKYDFNDFMGDKDFSNMFVTKVMRTKTGNCHGLPYYYKILSNELNAESYLAIAPNHMYIKHIDENGKWVNIELTNGHISSDAWIISSMGISAEAIKKGIYMDALTEKQSVALCLWDLATAYQQENGYDKFVLKCCNTVINYYPTSITALMTKQNCLNALGRAEQEKAKRNGRKETPAMKKAYKEYMVLNKHIEELGYREMPRAQYEQWIKAVDEERYRTSSN